MRPRTIELNKQTMNIFVDYLGDKHVDSINRNVIEMFMIYLRDEKKYNSVSINMFVRTLKAIFGRAVKEYDMLKDHPFMSIKLYTENKQNRKAIYLTADQVELLQHSIDNEHLLRIIRFYLWTGCRRSEATELTWEDVDGQNGQIYLGNSESKTKLRREFPLTDRLRLLLQELNPDKGQSERVFWRFAPDGRNISNKIRKIRQRVDLLPDNLTLHTLRPTFAAHLIMRGVDMSTVAFLMGHSTTQVTERYSHLQPDHKLAAANNLQY